MLLFIHVLTPLKVEETTPQKKVNPSFAKHYVLLVVGGVVFGTMGLDLDSCIERVCFFVLKLFTFSLCASLQVVLFPFHPFLFFRSRRRLVLTNFSLSLFLL